MLYTMYMFLTSDKKPYFTWNDWVFHNIISLFPWAETYCLHKCQCSGSEFTKEFTARIIEKNIFCLKHNTDSIIWQPSIFLKYKKQPGSTVFVSSTN